MSEEHQALEELSQKINKLKISDESGSSTPGDTIRHSSLAMRLSIELLAGVVVGSGLGYFLDDYLGSFPLFLVIFILIGFAAGVLNMKRATDRLDNEAN